MEEMSLRSLGVAPTGRNERILMTQSDPNQPDSIRSKKFADYKFASSVEKIKAKHF